MQRTKPRQDPISCQLCRSKKLKCDRRQPCSNCVARGVTCQSQNSETHYPAPDPDQTVQERLKRLEDAVFGPNVRAQRPTSQHEEPAAKRLALTPVSQQGINNDLDQSRQEEADKFELLGTREDSLVSSDLPFNSK